MSGACTSVCHGCCFVGILILMTSLTAAKLSGAGFSACLIFVPIFAVLGLTFCCLTLLICCTGEDLDMDGTGSPGAGSPGAEGAHMGSAGGEAFSGVLSGGRPGQGHGGPGNGNYRNQGAAHPFTEPDVSDPRTSLIRHSQHPNANAPQQATTESTESAIGGLD